MKTKTKNRAVCAFFLFSLSCVKSPSYTLSPSHDPNPHPWLLPKSSSQDTSCLAPTSDLRTEDQRSGRECSHAPTCQPGLTGMPPLTGFFASSGSLPPFFQVISAALDARDSTTKRTPGPGAESHGEWRTVSWYWHHDRWCWLCAFIGSPNHTLTPPHSSPRENSEMHSHRYSTEQNESRKMVRPNVQRGTYEHSQESHSPNRKAVRPPHQLDCEMVLYSLSKYLVNTKLHRAMHAGNAALNKTGMPSPQPKIGTMPLYRLSHQGKLPCKRKYEEVILTEARNIVGSGR